MNNNKKNVKKKFFFRKEGGDETQCKQVQLTQNLFTFSWIPLSQ
jgi:hypothetical protein